MPDDAEAPSPSPARADINDLWLTARLLSEVFPTSDVGQPSYLRWLYRDSPFGSVIEANLDDSEGRAGHYALTPVALTLDGLPRAGALSLNTAIHPRAQGRGVFVDLASEALDLARERSVELVLGVANANSTPGFTRRLGFQLVTSLPATVLVPRPGRAKTHFESSWVTSPESATLAGYEHLFSAAPVGLARVWTAETFAWRLASPSGRYAIHVGDDILLVTTVYRRLRVNVVLMLKVLASASVAPSTEQALVRHICRWHRAPLALHTGVNSNFAPKGPPLPSALRPSPLNLIYRDLTHATAAPHISCFELLDFDAY